MAPGWCSPFKFKIVYLKKLFLFILTAAQLHTGFAQQYRFSVSGGGNASFLKNFQSEIRYVEGFVIPDLLIIDNGKNLRAQYNAPSQAQAKTGFYADGMLTRKLRDNWGLSVSLGVMQTAFTYDTKIGMDGVSMKSVWNGYGDSRFTYLYSKLLNVEKQFNRLGLQAGPVLSYLVAKKYSNTVIRYGSDGKAVAGYFEEKGAPRKFLVGGQLHMRYQILKPLDIVLGAGYSFNALYKKENTGEDMYKKSRPLQVSLGLNYRLVGF